MIELHRHFDISVRRSSLHEIAQKKGLVPSSESLAAFESRFILRKPMSDLSSVLASFELFQHVWDRPETIERLAAEIIEDIAAEGIRKTELRFSPSFMCEKSGLSWDEATDALVRGMDQGCARVSTKLGRPIQAGLIAIASRDYGIEGAEKTVDFFLSRRKDFVGLDLAGNEADYPCEIFESAFVRAKKAGARITIHAGEGAGPDNVWSAIERLGAERIGHGIASIHDPQLMDYLSAHQICLEVCPTSNWLTGIVPRLADHPLPKLLRAGVLVCINTDDPAIFGVTLPSEIEVCRKAMGLSDEELELCQGYAERASFIA